jgi:hypothetical protein
MNKDLNKILEDLLGCYIQTIEGYHLNQLKKAKNKAFVQDRFLNQARGLLRFYIQTTSKHEKASNYFIEKYNLGEDIEIIVNKIIKNYPEAMTMVPQVDEKENIEIIPFGKEEKQLLKEFPKEMQSIISFYVGYLALNETLKRIPNYLNQTDAKSTSKTKKNELVQWTAPRDAKNDFVQLIYGLHLAGFISNGKGEIIKITESLADTFGIELGKNWQSNHSASIHRANKDYIPPIFDEMKAAYLKYSKGKQHEKDKMK